MREDNETLEFYICTAVPRADPFSFLSFGTASAYRVCKIAESRVNRDVSSSRIGYYIRCTKASSTFIFLPFRSRSPARPRRECFFYYSAYTWKRELSPACEIFNAPAADGSKTLNGSPSAFKNPAAPRCVGRCCETLTRRNGDTDGADLSYQLQTARDSWQPRRLLRVVKFQRSARAKLTAEISWRA